MWLTSWLTSWLTDVAHESWLTESVIQKSFFLFSDIIYRRQQETVFAILANSTEINTM